MTAGGAPAGWDAIVLAGGQSRRMGADKLALEVGGLTLLERVLQAVADADRLVVVGPQRDVTREVLWCREEPAGGGPAAAVQAGLAHVERECVVLLAADQPFADRGVVAELLRAAQELDGAVAVDGSGHPQWLCSAWRADALRGARLGPDVSLRASIGALRWTPLPVEAQTALDCDTPEDLRRARELTQ